MVWEYLTLAGADAFFSVVKLVLAIILPILHLVLILQLRGICISNLKAFSSRREMQRHIFGAIRNALGTCSAISIGADIHKLVYVLALANLGSPPDRRDPAEIGHFEADIVALLSSDMANGNHTQLLTLEAQDELIQNRGSAALTSGLTHALTRMAVSIALMLMALWYHAVGGDFNEYEERVKAFERQRFVEERAARRVKREKGARCILRHLIEMPKLEGEVGWIDNKELDERGRVLVRIGDGDEVLPFEEWQVCKPEGSAQQSEEERRYELTKTDIEDKKEKHDARLSRRQKAFVVVTQARTPFSLALDF